MINILFLLLFSQMGHSNTLQVATSIFPPFQYIENDKVKGISTEIVKKVIENAGYNANIKVYPWPRVLKLGMKERELLIYSISRSPDRENKFKWIGDIGYINYYFWKLKARKDIKITTIQDAKKYTIGVPTANVVVDHLINLGFVPQVNLDFVTSYSQNLRRLFAGKNDLIIQDDLTFRDAVKEEKLDFSLFEKKLYKDGLSPLLYLVATLGTPDEVVEKLRKSLIDFKKTKKYHQIINQLQ